MSEQQLSFLLTEAPREAPVEANHTSTALPPSYLADLNPEQRQAVEAPRLEAVKVLAGAGTGKTKLIAHRFVKLVSELTALEIDRPQDRILTVTFTDEAAKELRSRIHQALLDMQLEGLGEEAYISTFHRFCMRVIKQHPETLGLPANFEILEPASTRKLFTRILEDIKCGTYADLTHVFNQYQLSDLIPADILSLERLKSLPLDGIAEFLSRIPKLVNRIKSAGLSPREFQTLSSAQSTALSDCLKNLPLGEPFSGEAFDSIRTYCAAWKKALSGWAAESWNPLGIESGYNELKEKDYYSQIDFISKGLNLLKWTPGKKRYLPFMPDYTLLDEATDIEQQLIPVIAATYALYLYELKALGSVDFDGLIQGTIQLLSEHPTLRQYYQNYFEAIIVDEFQDSNGSELKLLKLLLKEAAPNLTVVGDEKQSIYGFRFSQRENMDLVFGQHSHTGIHLHTNYRSLPPILAVANKLTLSLSENNAAQQLRACDKHALKENPMVSWITLGVPIEPPPLKEGETYKKPRPEAIGSVKIKEARFIAVEIARLVEEEGVSYGDIAILVKKHHKCEGLQAAMQALGIPSVRKKNMGFFQEAVIKDAMALMQLAATPEAETPLIRILQSKLSHQQLRQLTRIRRTLKADSLLETLSLLTSTEYQGYWHTAPTTAFSPELITALENLAAEIETAAELAETVSPVELFRHLGRRLGLILPSEPPETQQQKFAHLKLFEKLIMQIEAGLGPSFSIEDVVAALEEYRSDTDLPLPEPDADTRQNAVQMMTVHGSKGLEFPVVFVAYSEEGRLPKLDDSRLLFDPQFQGKEGFGLIFSTGFGGGAVKKEVYKKIWHQPRLEEEEKRLFYVALTRAKERLYVLRAQQSFDWSGPEAYKTSSMVILNEMDPDQGQYLKETYWQREAKA